MDQLIGRLWTLNEVEKIELRENGIHVFTFKQLMGRYAVIAVISCLMAAAFVLAYISSTYNIPLF